jgi:hypothetical protein
LFQDLSQRAVEGCEKSENRDKADERPDDRYEIHPLHNFHLDNSSWRPARRHFRRPREIPGRMADWLVIHNSPASLGTYQDCMMESKRSAVKSIKLAFSD